jgi:glutamyl-tRNA synthetase
MTIRVRFAPSPTGYLHVGGLRTALYNYLFARQQGGVFVLRIEDTDRTRYVEGAVENLINSLRWCGIDFDEGPGKEGPYGPYIQSQRLDIYREHVQRLIDAGYAYYAFDTPEELEAMRQEQIAAGIPSTRYDRQRMKNSLSCSTEQIAQWQVEGMPAVIRLKIPEREAFSFADQIRGVIEFSAEHVDDQILMKSDGYPTYHLASVVDDHAMEITHIIRGEEWLSSVPKHLVLYEYFGWQVPAMIHLPLLLNSDRSKLSKRQNDVAVEDYKTQGYQPEALVNFVALLGWSPGDDREIFSFDELINAFSIERINKSGAIFDLDKLKWINRQRIRQMPIETLAAQAQAAIAQAGLSVPSYTYLQTMLELLRERITLVNDVTEAGIYFLRDPETFDEEIMRKRWKPQSSALVQALAECLAKLEVFDASVAENSLKQLAQDQKVKVGILMISTRIAITGSDTGPDLFPIMELLGQQTCIRRLQHAASYQLA